VRRRRKNKLPIVVSLIIVFISFFVYYSNYFERVAPVVAIDKKIFWNLQNKINVSIKDNANIKSYRVVLKSQSNETVLIDKQNLSEGVVEKTLSISPPAIISYSPEDVKLEITVADNSYWNFFMGNITKKIVDVTVDKVIPKINSVYQTRHIKRGGSAAIIFRARDNNLENVYIDTGKHKFYPTKFYKDGYYLSLIGWDINDDNFKVVVVAEDKAGNFSKKVLTLYQSNKEYRTSYIRLKDSFINNEISSLIDELYMNSTIEKPNEKFKLINEVERQRNEEYIHAITAPTDLEYKDIKFRAFKPLPHSMVVASFGDHRFYYKQNRQNIISESFHLGIDLASVKMAPIKTTSTAKVVSHKSNGIYGNMPVLYHGLGLYTIYGHCSNILVNEGDIVTNGDSIAQTGKTGLALGDHLHFGVLIQGVEVNPYDWMRQDFIDKSIIDVIAKAKHIIDGEIIK
jgi:murein DD-endopeptidase MepM/ murein hydrolase activator NlpD